MPQFPSTPTRARILEKIPDYQVRLSPMVGEVKISTNGILLAKSTNARLVEETRHGDVYYLPAEDVLMDLFEANEHSTYCPFKGHASYWNLKAGDRAEENLVWAYMDPYAEVEEIKGLMSFYSDRTDIELA